MYTQWSGTFLYCYNTPLCVIYAEVACILKFNGHAIISALHRRGSVGERMRVGT